MTKKITFKNCFAFVITILIIASCFLSANFFNYKTFVAEGISCTGDGSKETPYLIESSAQLTEISTSVNSGNSFSGKYFKLSCDINMQSNSFTPIGYNTTYAFSGNLDGDAHTISKFVFTNDASQIYYGLFGYVKNAQIDNLIISLTGTVSIMPNANANVGTLCGFVESSTITNCKVIGQANISADSYGTLTMGGMFGTIDSSTISKCTIKDINLNSYNEMSGKSNFLGGLAGIIQNKSTIKMCSADNKVTLTCKSTKADQKLYLGGIVGTIDGTVGTCTLSRSFSMAKLNIDASVISTNCVGGIAGNSVNTNIADCYYRDVYQKDLTVADYSFGKVFDFPSFAGATNSIGGITGKTTGTITNCSILNCYVDICFSDYLFDATCTGFVSGSISSKDLISNCYYFNYANNYTNSAGTTINFCPLATADDEDMTIAVAEDRCSFSNYTGFEKTNWTNDKSGSFINNGYPVIKGADNDFDNFVADIIRQGNAYATYATLEDAFADSVDDDIIEIISDDVTVSNSITVSKKVTLVALIGTSVKISSVVVGSLFVIEKDASLTIGQNSVNDKDIVILGSNDFNASAVGCATDNDCGFVVANGPIVVNNNLTVNGFNSANLFDLEIGGCEMNSINIKNNSTSNLILIGSTSNLIVKNGVFSQNECDYLIYNTGSLNISGGDYRNNTINSTDSITIYDSGILIFTGYTYIFDNNSNLFLGENIQISATETADTTDATNMSFGLYLSSLKINYTVIVADSDEYLNYCTFVLKNSTKDSDSNDLFLLSKTSNGSCLVLIGNTYTIEYYDGDTLITTLLTNSYTYGTGVAKLENATKTDYTFIAWYGSADFSGDEISSINASDFGNKKFYAKFETSIALLTLQLDSDGVVDVTISSLELTSDATSSVSLSNNVSVTKGDQTLKIVLDAGSYLDSLTIAGTKQTGDALTKATGTGLTITINSDTIVAVVVRSYKFKIKLVGDGGTITNDADGSENLATDLYHFSSNQIVGVADEGHNYKNAVLSTDYDKDSISLSALTEDTINEKLIFYIASLNIKQSLIDKNEINFTITCKFVLMQYQLTINSFSNGTITIDGVAVSSAGIQKTYEYGDSVELLFTADSNYCLNYVTIDDQIVKLTDNNTKYVIQKVTADLNLVASFGIKQYTVNVQSEYFNEVSFTINGEHISTKSFNAEETATISVYDLLGNAYQFVEYYTKVDSTEQTLSSNINYSFTVDSTIVIYARLKARVMFENVSNGTISATLDGQEYTEQFYCNYNDQITVASLADRGYYSSGFEYDLTVDNENKLNVIKPIVIKPVFLGKEFSITASTTGGENGLIVASARVTKDGSEVLTADKFVFNGANSFTIYFALNDDGIGYQFGKFIGNQTGIIQNSTEEPDSAGLYQYYIYTITPEDTELGNGLVSIIAKFALKTFTVKVNCDEIGGTFSVVGQTASPYIVEYNKYLIVNCQVDDMYKFLERDITLTAGSTYMKVGNSIRITYVLQNIELTIKFEPKTWWDNPAEFFDGDGTTQNPYKIRNAMDLALMSYVINNGVMADLSNGNQNYLTAYYKLLNNIDCGTEFFFVPIGTNTYPFNGTFDYNYLKIDSIMTEKDPINYKYGGLFDKIGENGRIINQFRSKIWNVLFISGIVVVVVGAVLLVIYFEKKKNRPKKVFILPKNVGSKNNNVSPGISRPDLTKLKK